MVRGLVLRVSLVLCMVRGLVLRIRLTLVLEC